MVPIEDMTDDVAGWLYRAERLVAEIVGVDSWDEAVRALSIPARSRLSLLAYYANLPADEEVPAQFARLATLREKAADPNFMKHGMEDTARMERGARTQSRKTPTSSGRSRFATGSENTSLSWTISPSTDARRQERLRKTPPGRDRPLRETGAALWITSRNMTAPGGRSRVRAARST